METFKKNSSEIKKAIKANRRRVDRELAQTKFPHEKHGNYPEPLKKSSFDMTDNYYNNNMNPKYK